MMHWQIQNSQKPCSYVRYLVSVEYLCHVYVRSDSLAGVVIADSEYPSRVAFTLLEKVSVVGLDWVSGGREAWWVPSPEQEG